MAHSARGRRAGSWVGALLSLLIAASLSPSTTRAAGCQSGHPAEGAPGAAHLELLEVAGAVAAEPAGTPTPPSLPRPAPCSGVFCSGDPATPLAPATSLVAPVAEEWAIAAVEAVPLAPARFAFAAGGPRARPIGWPDSIFHPPRIRARPIL